MAAVVIEDKLNLDLVALWEHITMHLPEYARPLFLRVRKELEITATFKKMKCNLVNDGYDPRHITDGVYFFDAVRQEFVPLGSTVYDQIQSGRMRL
jgi:hypothetical protein